MKTKEELFVQFQSRFDQDREKDMKNFRRWIIITLIVISIHILIRLFSGKWCLLFHWIEFLMMIGLIKEFIINLKKSSITYQIKKTKMLIDRKKLAKQYPETIHNNIIKDVSVSPETLADWITHWKEAVKTYETTNYKKIIEALSKDIYRYNYEINDLEVWLEVYDKSLERNFWQYIKSIEWPKIKQRIINLTLKLKNHENKRRITYPDSA